MTIRAMLSVCAVGVGSLGLVACGGPASLSSDNAEELKAARSEAAEATAALDELRRSFTILEGRFERLEEAENAEDRRAENLGERLDVLSDKLKNRADNLRAAVDAASSSAATASSEVSSAMAEARSAAQALNLLRVRYDEHLRRFHGGG